MNSANLQQALLAPLSSIHREISERSLSGFIRSAWPVLEPSQPYVHGWHIDAMSEHLEAVTDGEITRLLINVPPGMMKSMEVSVFWPAWEWGPKGMSYLRYLTSSYSEDYVKRDSRRMRDLVTSDWYKEIWGDEISLIRTGEAAFANNKTGWREGKPFRSLTGGRGDRVIIDDPHSTETAESEKERGTTTRIFLESVPTRLNNPATSAIVVIMQRLHERDVSGAILAKDLGYEHLMLPMEFEADRKCVTSIGFEDPRTVDGELLFPERFSKEVVDRDKRVMGLYATAGQFQQRPAPRGGGMFKRDNFAIVDSVPEGGRVFRGWDLAATESETAAWTAGVKMTRVNNEFYISHVERFRGTAGVVQRKMVSTAETDGRTVRISIPQDPGQAGKAQAKYLIGELSGFRAKATPESGDKVTRAQPFAAQVEAGNVKILRAPWNEDYLSEMETFPHGAYMDQVDATSRVFNELSGRGQTRMVPITGI